jgi:two-component system KDP operon response regulator KdpE
LTHHYLLRTIWGPGYVNQSQYLRVFIAQLRKKIENDANRPQYLLTESGVGYRFVSGFGMYGNTTIAEISP